MSTSLVRVGFRCRRAAYTLIEMLIASVLVAALMSVVWGMMSMYNSYLTLGHAQATEQQLARSLFQLFMDDLQSVALTDRGLPDAPTVTIPSDLQFPVPAVDDGLQVSAGTPATWVSVSSTDTSPGSIELTGTSQAMRLTIRRPSGRLVPDNLNPTTAATVGSVSTGDGDVGDLTSAHDSLSGNSMEPDQPDEGESPRVDEFQTIVYQFQSGFGLSRGTQALPAGLYRIQTNALSLQVVLNQRSELQRDRVRTAGDAAGDAAADDPRLDRPTLEILLLAPESEGSDLQTDRTLRMALQFERIPEVLGCRFQYFDGGRWYSSWNSTARRGLPSAVRIQLRLASAGDVRQLDHLTASDNEDVLLQQTTSAQDEGIVSAGQDAAAGFTDSLKQVQTRLFERIVVLQPVTPVISPSGGSVDEAVLRASWRPESLR